MKEVALLLPPIFMLLQANLLEAQTFREASNLLRSAENIPALGGACAVDFNNDGLADIYTRGRLYLNKGSAGFVDVLLSTNMIPGGDVFGAAFGDYDNDGYPDIFFEDLAASGRLYRNRRNGAFTRTDQTTNLAAHPAAQGAAWGDFNLDGKLDLFVNNDFGTNRISQSK
ncbi:VCBS repeat-containing protein [candidate division KSB1 bacterium]|nr:VCBS repeat-containing protein [candidate division KSB1 bacterium]